MISELSRISSSLVNTRPHAIHVIGPASESVSYEKSAQPHVAQSRLMLLLYLFASIHSSPNFGYVTAKIPISLAQQMGSLTLFVAAWILRGVLQVTGKPMRLLRVLAASS